MSSAYAQSARIAKPTATTITATSIVRGQNFGLSQSLPILQDRICSVSMFQRLNGAHKPLTPTFSAKELMVNYDKMLAQHKRKVREQEHTETKVMTFTPTQGSYFPEYRQALSHETLFWLDVLRQGSIHRRKPSSEFWNAKTQVDEHEDIQGQGPEDTTREDRIRKIRADFKATWASAQDIAQTKSEMLGFAARGC